MDSMEVESSATQDGERIVHLDLKGAPPRISYYEMLFPLLQKWGATGLLVEYEDMFPYWGDLQDIAAPNAYSKAEIGRLLELAKQHNLSVVPLIQTFGHFEFVLKHEKFRSLREVPQFPMTLCPLNKDSLRVVSQMVDQVLELHPDITWFNIGADEVFHLGVCDQCQSHMKTEGLSTAQLFFIHVRKVLQYIKGKHPKLQLMMWDDMFRDVDVDTIKGSGIGQLVEPMVWYYCSSFQFPAGMWDRYSAVFPNVWVASAFKGATGPCMYAVDVAYHIENHKAWLALVQSEIRPKFQNFRGYAVTGWARYDHYSVLCELLPVGLPSLALCLLTLSNGGFTVDNHRQASADLKFSDLIPVNPFKSLGSIPQCNFPGSAIFIGVQVLLLLTTEYKSLRKNDRLKGWMTDYHIQHNFTNPAHVQHILPQAQHLFQSLSQLQKELRTSLSEVLYPDAVDEWMACNVDPKVNKITSIVENAQKQNELAAIPKQFPNGLQA